MNRRLMKLPLLAGTAATALLLSACGSDGAANAPAPQVTVTTAAAPSSVDPSPSASASESALSAADREVGDNEAELDVEDQRGDGSSVAVEEVRLTSGTGFVAIYTPDNQLLGSAKVSSGSQARLTVDLDDRISASDDDHRAVLFADEGDGSFDPTTDPRVVEGDDDADDDNNDEDDDDGSDDDDDRDRVDDEFDYTLS